MLSKVATEPHCGCHNPANQGLLPLDTGCGVPSREAKACCAMKGTEMGLQDGGQCP